MTAMSGPRCVVANVLDCNIVESEFKIYSFCYVYFWTNTFWKGMNPLISLVSGKIVTPLLFYNHRFGI